MLLIILSACFGTGNTVVAAALNPLQPTTVRVRKFLKGHLNLWDEIARGVDRREHGWQADDQLRAPPYRHALSFLSVATILTVIGAGIAGSALTYGLTWLRESRRTKDANRAPQRAAIAEIVEATYELTLRVFAFRDAREERARQSEGKTFRRVSDAELEELTNQAQRALFGVGWCIPYWPYDSCGCRPRRGDGSSVQQFLQAPRRSGGRSGDGADSAQHAGEDGEHCLVHWGAQSRHGHAGEGGPEAAFSGADVVE